MGRRRTELDAIYGECKGYPGAEATERQVRKYLNRHTVGHKVFGFGSSAFFSGTCGRKVQQIRDEDRLRAVIRRKLDRASAPAEITHSQIKDFILKPQKHRSYLKIGERSLEHLAVSPSNPTARMELRHYGTLFVTVYLVLGVLLAILALLIRFEFANLTVGITVVVGAAILFVLGPHVGRFLLASREIKDADQADKEPDNHQPPDRPYQRSGEGKEEITKYEDIEAQSAMVGLTHVKPGLVRWVTLRIVLWFINFAAAYVATKGELSGISTIHYARWVIIDKGKRLLFCSDYDSSWEGYLGEFVDQAAPGLTAVWSNCVGFPKTLWLTEGGARNEQAFKKYSRESMIPIQVRYSAYPELSVRNINHNSAIRADLVKGVDGQDMVVSRQGGVLRPVPTPRLEAEPAPVIEKDKPPNTSKVPVDLRDTQGIIVRGYAGLEAACFLLLEIEDPGLAKRWLKNLAGDFALRDEKENIMNAADTPKEFAVNIAFTRDGLDELGLRTDEEVIEEPVTQGGVKTRHRHRGFSTQFIDGMTTPHRQRVLGDINGSDPET